MHKPNIDTLKREFAINGVIDLVVKNGLENDQEIEGVFAIGQDAKLLVSGEFELQRAIVDYFRSGRLEKSYATQLTGNAHVIKIDAFRTLVSAGVSPMLTNRELSFGRAQYMVNQFVKHAWVYGLLETMPPHCPIHDDDLLWELVPHGAPWIDWKSSEFTKAVYVRVMQAAQVAAEKEGLSIAEWELAFYDRKRKESEQKRKENLSRFFKAVQVPKETQ